MATVTTHDVRRIEAPAASGILGFGASAVIAIAAGLMTDAFAARGPVDTGDGLAVMALAFGVGIAGGALTHTRWSIVVLLIGYIVGVELGRRQLVAPTLAFRFDTAYGIIAFVLTRGIHLVLVVVPLTMGVLIGRGVAARADGVRSARPRLGIGSVLVGGLAIGLAVLVAWPASTPPVLGSGGTPVPNGLAELATVKLGGAEHRC